MTNTENTAPHTTGTETRRSFLNKLGVATVALTASRFLPGAGASAAAATVPAARSVSALGRRWTSRSMTASLTSWMCGRASGAACIGGQARSARVMPFGPFVS